MGIDVVTVATTDSNIERAHSGANLAATGYALYTGNPLIIGSVGAYNLGYFAGKRLFVDPQLDAMANEMLNQGNFQVNSALSAYNELTTEYEKNCK